MGFILRGPSGRTCCVDKGRLPHSNYWLKSISPNLLVPLCVNASGSGDGCYTWADRDAAAAAAACESAAFMADIWEMPAHRLMGMYTFC